jgi:hypothetical protein
MAHVAIVTRQSTTSCTSSSDVLAMRTPCRGHRESDRRGDQCEQHRLGEQLSDQAAARRT